jgi:hypothetical protein
VGTGHGLRAERDPSPYRLSAPKWQEGIETIKAQQQLGRRFLFFLVSTGMYYQLDIL